MYSTSPDRQTNRGCNCAGDTISNAPVFTASSGLLSPSISAGRATVPTCGTLLSTAVAVHPTARSTTPVTTTEISKRSMDGYLPLRALANDSRAPDAGTKHQRFRPKGRSFALCGAQDDTWGSGATLWRGRAKHVKRETRLRVPIRTKGHQQPITATTRTHQHPTSHPPRAALTSASMWPMYFSKARLPAAVRAYSVFGIRPSKVLRQDR